MELNLFINYYYGGRSLYQEPDAIKQLSAACRTYGISAVRTTLRTTKGHAPYIIKTLDQDEEGNDIYWLTKYCYNYILNNKLVYSTINYPSNIEGAIGRNFKYYRSRLGNILYKIPEDLIIYNGYPLQEWITHGVECEDCGTPFICPDGGEHLCNNCLQQYEVRPYSHKAEEELGFEQTREIRYGLELEYEEVSAKDVIKTLKNHAIPKRDGSIRHGVEIVTRPACVQTHKQHLRNFFKQIKTKAYANTGMHIHIERKKLSEYQIGFIMAFLNNENLVGDIIKIAGRDYTQNQYTRFNKNHTMTHGIYYDTYAHTVLRSPTDKYSPLNTAKPNTVEVRIFSSPESAEECFAKLDFVAALVKYSSPYSVSVKSLKDKFNWNVFTSYIAQHRKDYPDFYNYFIKKAA